MFKFQIFGKVSNLSQLIPTSRASILVEAATCIISEVPLQLHHHDCLLESCRSQVSKMSRYNFVIKFWLFTSYYKKFYIFLIFSYVQYSTIAARAVRQALKGEAKDAAVKRGKSQIFTELYKIETVWWQIWLFQRLSASSSRNGRAASHLARKNKLWALMTKQRPG